MQLPTQKSKIETDLSKYTYLIYGQPKVGKTTFCASFENALFICTEPGHKFQEIYKVSPLTWSDIVNVKGKKGAKDHGIIANLLSGKHEYKNIIFDTVDNAYRMASDYICKENNIQDPADLQFGKGYALVKKEFIKVINALTQSGYGVIFISHAQTRDVEDKNVKRSKTDSTLSGSASKVISGLCDFILYCDMDHDGNRYMITKSNPNLNAGDRTGKLPAQLPLDYKTFKTELSKAVEGLNG